MRTKAVVILVTCANKREARRIAQALLRKKLVACVNLVDRVESFFRWQGRIDHAKELLLIIKTRASKSGAVVKAVKAMHRYTVPEVIALPVIAGNRDYLEWIDESTTAR